MQKNINCRIGEVIRDKRMGKKLSQEQLALASDVDRSYVSILERGLKSPTIETLERIPTALGCSLAQLVLEAQK